MWFNPFMTWLLRSPFHRLVSQNTLLITYTGRKSGKVFTTPVNYQRIQRPEGEYLLTISLRTRTWWRNLRGGAAVQVYWMGKELAARSEVFEDEQQVAAELAAYVKTYPAYARYLGIQMGPDGQPRSETAAQAARERVVIHTNLAA